MHPVPAREHAGLRETPGSAANDLLSAIGLTIVAAIDLITALLYGFSSTAR
jgi:hypothetical protein